MDTGAWMKELGASIVVCDAHGVILEMNDRAAATFAKDGGRALVGRNLFDCHPGQSKQKLQALLERREPNAYTIEKNGVKKLIYQAPWFEQGEYRGFVELSLVIPFEMPHFVRSTS